MNHDVKNQDPADYAIDIDVDTRFLEREPQLLKPPV